MSPIGLIPDPVEEDTYIVADATGWLFGEHIGPTVLHNVHRPTACAGRHCIIHNPSDHHMRTWRLTWRDDKGVFERECPHVTGHPDPDDAAYLALIGKDDWVIHTCDGCCEDPR